MSLPLRRKRATTRREAASIEELVLHIAEDKSRSRFRPIAPGTERARDVFLEAVARVVEPLEELGFKYAKRGPHATRRTARTLVKVYFGSNTLNGPGELVALHISIEVQDSDLGAWRNAHTPTRRADDVVSTKHLGHLLDPPVWLEWNLAERSQREATIADVARTIESHGLPFIELITSLLDSPRTDPVELMGLVDDEALVEYLTRAGRTEEAASLVEAIVARFHERGRAHFNAQVVQLRSDGLPEVQSPGAPNGLEFLVVQHDLPVQIE